MRVLKIHKQAVLPPEGQNGYRPKKDNAYEDLTTPQPRMNLEHIQVLENEKSLKTSNQLLEKYKIMKDAPKKKYKGYEEYGENLAIFLKEIEWVRVLANWFYNHAYDETTEIPHDLIEFVKSVFQKHKEIF